MIEHCTTTDHHGVTPSDFPLARVTQRQLDGLGRQVIRGVSREFLFRTVSQVTLNYRGMPLSQVSPSLK